MVARENGLAIVDLIDIVNPVILAVIPSAGNEDVLFTSDCKFMFFAEGFRGLTIYNLENISDPKLMSNLQLGGWTTQLSLTKDEKYIFAT